MEGHVFMSQELRDRVKENVAPLHDNTVIVRKSDGQKFVSGYRNFFLSPLSVKITGRLDEGFPSWLCESTGTKIVITIFLRSARIDRLMQLSQISVDCEDETWTITGEILIE